MQSTVLPKKDTKKSNIAKRMGQIKPMCDPKTTSAYSFTKPNWIGSSSLHICGTEKISRNIKNSFRGKIFSREDIFAGSYFCGKIFLREDIFANILFTRKYLPAKIFQINFSRKFPTAKIKCYTVFE